MLFFRVKGVCSKKSKTSRRGITQIAFLCQLLYLLGNTFLILIIFLRMAGVPSSILAANNGSHHNDVSSNAVNDYAHNLKIEVIAFLNLNLYFICISSFTCVH